MFHLRLTVLVVCGLAALVGCGGNATGTPLAETAAPPTATSMPATAVPAPPATTPPSTAAPLPTTVAPVLRATVLPISTPVSRTPFGSPPPGWKTYAGNLRLPFSVYYPPDWTVDETELATKGQVKFFSPTQNPSLWIHVGTERTTTSIDTLRDSQAKALAQSCVRSGVELTQQGKVSGVVFNELVVSCDLAAQGQLSVFLLGVGLNNGFAWDITAYSPRKDFNRNSCGCPAGNVEAYFDLMLNSANIYDDPAG